MSLKLNIGSGKSARKDCINIDINNFWKPDIIHNLNEPFKTKDYYIDRLKQSFSFKPNTIQDIYALDVLEHIQNLTGLMTECLRVLKFGGNLHIHVPYYLSLGAWQDPTHIRAFNENSWLYYTAWFWYLGWTDAKFELSRIDYIGEGRVLSNHPKLKEKLKTPTAIDSMSLILTKVELNASDLDTLKNRRF